MRNLSLLLLSAGSIALARVAPAAPPAITPAPSLEQLDLRRREDGMNLASLAEVLLTAVPPSILDLALTNVPAVSRLLWSEFLDGNTPAWFTALPTDVQRYLSGEFGPTTAASNSDASATVSQPSASTTSSTAASETALNNQAANSSSDNHDHHGGLPLWAKIVIGLVVPLLVLALIALALVCIFRRRRRRASLSKANSRPLTPAFTSSGSQRSSFGSGVGKRPAMRGGYLSNPDIHRQTPRSSHNTSSDSEEFHTPIGGPSYEEMPRVAGIGMQQTSRGSRYSFGSLHSVPEVPEPMHNKHIPKPPLRSPGRSRDLSNMNATDLNARRRRSSSNAPAYDNDARISPLNPAYKSDGGGRAMQENPYSMGQGIYAGDHNPYYSNGNPPYDDNPFSDPPPPHQDGYMASGGYRGSAGAEPRPLHVDKRHIVDDDERNWPLRSPVTRDEYGNYERVTNSQWNRGNTGQGVYEMS